MVRLGGQILTCIYQLLFREERGGSGKGGKKMEGKGSYGNLQVEKPGDTLQKFGWGCAALSLKTLSYFRPKYVIFPTLF